MKFNRLKRNLKPHRILDAQYSYLCISNALANHHKKVILFGPYMVKDSTEIIVGAERLGEIIGPLLQGKR